MNFLKIAGEDIKSVFKNRFIRVSIVAIIVVPLLYSLLYLYAFWDPYAKLEDVPVAVVNLDNGATLDGKKVNYGKDIVEELDGNTELGWTITTEEDARDGLEGQKYYAKVIIPKDFSKSIIAAKEGVPKVADISFVTNDKKNFLAAQINSKVEAELKANITKTISSNYVEVTFDNLYEAKDGLVQAADGSKQISDGLSTLNESVPQLEDGVSKLYDGSSKLLDGQVTLNSGIGTLNDGIKQLNGGLSQLNGKVPTLSEGIDKLNSGALQLNDAGTKLNAGANGLVSNVDPLKDGSDTIVESAAMLKGGYASINAGVNEVLSSVASSSEALKMVQGTLNKALASGTDAEKNAAITQAIQIVEGMQAKGAENVPKLNELKQGTEKFNNSIIAFNDGVQGYTSKVKAFADGSKALSQGVIGYTAGVKEVSEGIYSLKANIPELKSGVELLYNGSNALVSGGTKLQDGSSQLVDGQKQLKDGVSELNSKTPELKDGVVKLADGSKELFTKLTEGADKMKNGLINSSKIMGEFISEPINMKLDAVNKVPNYGTGFAPYFIPLSLWIGAIMMFFVIPPTVKDDEKLSKFDKVVGKYLSYSFVGVLQAILVSVVVLMLGLAPTNIGMYILTNIFLSLVFIAIIQCLISLLGDAGRLLAIVFLIVQLTSCAGTFPLEIVPSFFKVMNPFMPFTYAVEALREVISADVINYSVLGKDFIILGIALIVFLGISIALKNVGEKIASKIEGRKIEHASL